MLASLHYLDNHGVHELREHKESLLWPECIVTTSANDGQCSLCQVHGLLTVLLIEVHRQKVSEALLIACSSHLVIHERSQRDVVELSLELRNLSSAQVFRERYSIAQSVLLKSLSRVETHEFFAKFLLPSLWRLSNLVTHRRPWLSWWEVPHSLVGVVPALLHTPSDSTQPFLLSALVLLRVIDVTKNGAEICLEQERLQLHEN
mmetsp:Transcript_256/g.846  ORF Transcript_256/g.846 Transcript_256/m.846 type:complete len:204 (+) Transcript_256:3026-3637(+)